MGLQRLIPCNYEADFARNPWNAVRRFTKEPLPALRPAFLDFESLRSCIDRDRENPFFVKTPGPNEDGYATPHLKGDFRAPQDEQGNTIPTVLWGHLDLSKNKDACGIAFVSVPKSVMVGNEKLPFIRVELLGCIRAPAGRQVGYNGIRQLIYDLMSRGFTLGMVTCDQFQSVDMLQQLNEKGVPADTLSIDRTTTYPKFLMRPIGGMGNSGAALKILVRVSTNGQFDAPMTALFYAIKDGRFSVPVFEESSDGLTLLEEEIMQLESNEQTGKVEKGPGATDDLVQAVAGAVFNATNNHTTTGFGRSVDELKEFGRPGSKQVDPELVYDRAAPLVYDDGDDQNEFDQGVDFL